MNTHSNRTNFRLACALLLSLLIHINFLFWVTSYKLSSVNILLDSTRFAFIAKIQTVRNAVYQESVADDGHSSLVAESITHNMSHDESLLFNPAQKSVQKSSIVNHTKESQIIVPVEAPIDSNKIMLPRASSYLESARLDQPPMPLNIIEPEYPDSVGMQQGSVELRILINEHGLVDDVSVVRSFPPQLFDRSAIMAFSKAIFAPGKYLGIPVKSQISVEIEFTPYNRGGNVSDRGY